MSNVSNPTLLFLHIPKSGGITMRQILLRQYGKDAVYRVSGRRPAESSDAFRLLPDNEKRKYRAVAGHIVFGLHEHLPGPATYITMLRDPVERLISHYYFAKFNPRHYLHEEINARGMSIEDYARSGLSPEIDNGQTKPLSGQYTPVGGCTADLLEQAKNNLRTHFVLAGLTERFDETLLLLKHKLGWSKQPFYVVENRTEDRKPRESLSARAIEVILEHSPYDAALYEFVRQRFDEEVKALGPGFSQELRSFQKKNRCWGMARLAVRRVYRSVVPLSTEE